MPKPGVLGLCHVLSVVCAKAWSAWSMPWLSACSAIRKGSIIEIDVFVNEIGFFVKQLGFFVFIIGLLDGAAFINIIEFAFGASSTTR